MICPYCSLSETRHLPGSTALGYSRFRCRRCHRSFNERTGTPYNFLEYPTDIVLLVVLWRLRYRLTFRDLAEMFLERGFSFTHEAVRDWEKRFAPLVTQKLRAKRKGGAGISWYVDETCIKVKGRWSYLYRAIDRDGNLVDSMLSLRRNLKSAKRFFKRALAVVGHRPDRVTTDGYDVYPKAIQGECGKKTIHRTNRYLNNGIEQDHRGIKQRYHGMRKFKSLQAASRFCTAFDELRNYLRPRDKMKQTLSLSAQRTLFLERWSALKMALQEV